MAFQAPSLGRGLSFEFASQQPQTSSSASSDASSDSSASSRDSSPPPAEDKSFTHVVNGEPRTTTQGKDWRGSSSIHKKRFIDRSWSEMILSSTIMDPSHHVLAAEGADKRPVFSSPIWADILFLAPTTSAVPLLQQICYSYGWQWSKPVAFVAYFLGLTFFFQLSAIRFNALGKKHGLFHQESRGRDRIPDDSVDIMGGGILMYFTWRVGCMMWSFYQPEVAPVSNFSWSYVLRWQAWFLVMDLIFYSYHRATHEVDFLWPIHSHHHKAKHPTMAHAILAGHMQHFLEIICIPTIATYVVPLTFHEQWILYLCLAHIETMGHSGARIHAPNPNTWLACLPFGAELTIEDHDLHHRFGKSGKNYGKQTRFWDKLFGTMEERVESKECTTRWI